MGSARARCNHRLELVEGARHLEVPRPPFVSGDTDREVAPLCRYGNDGVRLRIVVGLTPADIVTDVALESHVVGCTRSPRPSVGASNPFGRCRSPPPCPILRST